jgi:3-dehydroquinate synthase
MLKDWIITYDRHHQTRVRVGRGAAQRLADIWQPSWREAAIIGDATVMSIYGPNIARQLEPLVRRVEIINFPPGEIHKTRATKEVIEDQLLNLGVSRQTCVVALGGGISLDLAGFVAATYLRGVPYINIPTSLLAQVDAAIGGKTGVNTAQGKNLVGAFHQPSAVLIDSNFLPTLSPVEWPNGLAEMVKHAVIADAELFQWMEEHVKALGQPGLMDDYPLQRSVEIKTTIVQSDERESGRRSLLNFGHTVGHAMERATEHHLSHGRAVAMGMVIEARLAAKLTGIPLKEVDRLAKLLLDLYLDIKPPVLPFERLLSYLSSDKKRKEGELYMALPVRLGEMASEEGFTIGVPLQLLEEVWEMSL